MEKKQKVRRNAEVANFFSIIFSLSMIAILLLGNVEIFAFNSSYYKKQFSSLGVYSEFEMRGISRQQVDLYSEQVISFLRGSGELPAGLFNSYEASHMMDVRHLFLALKRILISAIALAAASLALLLAFFGKRGAVKAVFCFLRTAIASVALLALIAVVMFFPARFESIFTAFHQVFFSAGNWAFPEGSTIITLFPEAFFQHTAMGIFLLSAAELALLAAILFLCIKTQKFRNL